jgi:RHS repeat-associated protein
MTLKHRILLLLTVLFAFARFAPAQVTTGTPPFSSAAGGPEAIDLANLNAHYTVPVLSKLGRGSNFTYDLSYDSSVWYPSSVSGTQTWTPASNWGWTSSTAPVSGHLSTRSSIVGTCDKYTVLDHLPPVGIPQEFVTSYSWTFYDDLGSSHVFSGFTQTWTSSPCSTAGSSSLTTTATDGSGFQLQATGASGQVYDSKGTLLGPPINAFAGPGTLTDRNGNIISVDGSGNITDTLGTVALIVAGSGTTSSPITFTYTAPSGANAAYTVNYTNYTVATNFGVSGISEYLSSAAVPLITSIVLPDGTQYTLTYEPTPSTPSAGACTPYAGTTCVTGRLASITLPTGGTLSYTYTGGNNGILPDGSAATLTRTTPDGTWTYAQVKGSGAASTTTVTDPQGNKTAIQFQGIYETQRQISQLVSGSQVTQETINTCYNASSLPCTGTAVTLPITERQIRTTFPGGLNSEHDDFWNTAGGPTESDDYDFGTSPHGSLLRKILATYASLGNITAFRQTVTVENGGGTTVSEVNYNYDGTAVTATSGTPQHTSVSGSRGNLTSVNSYTQGATYLTKSSTYFDTGNVDVATDVNGAQTTFTYGACGNSFPISVSLPLSLSTSETWNCTGGVATSATDVNGQMTSTAYTNAYFWRPDSSTDQESNTTTYTYGTNPSTTESALSFNGGSSVATMLNTLDSLGRAHISQQLQAPGSTNFDSAETDYDTLGRAYRATMPYSGTAGQTNFSAPSTITQFDALNRPTQITDGGSGTLTFVYSQNDTLTKLGPAPSGENLKQRQLQYDALGRLTSVCEITSATGSGTCGQTSSQNGYWTQYTYDALGDLTGVTQNSQAASGQQQTRSYSYDEMGRLTSETNPESGTTTYTYDSDSSCGNSSGDPVKKIDAVGNVVCASYDALHRETSISVASGTYASVSPDKQFVYDSATVGGVAMLNVKGRRAEAYTCFSPCTSKITDLGLSYSVRGEISDLYESTPHSSGYYHSSLTYWPNGLADVLTGPGIPNITSAPDPEGRVSTVSAASGQNPVTGMSYNLYSVPPQMTITFGSADSDVYNYDANTGRVTQYRFNVGSQSVTGALAWNANGTPASLDITDPFNASDSQNCSYSHDDLGRLASVTCPSVWSQTFSYDPFGNLSQSGSASFQPVYYYSGQPITNQYIPFTGFTATYDANGNVTADPNHSYSWDAYGRPVVMDGVNLTYDALGQMVEQNRSGAYTQVAYTPTGAKLALMSGLTLVKAFIPLPSGAQAVYTASGLAYYRHADALGSSRLASTPAQTMYSDTAYAPFGETYAQTGASDVSYTGQNQDTAGGVYDFPAREFAQASGRWPSPDPLGLGSVNPSDPQTWNRYAYVRNSPLSFTDPSGMFLRVYVPIFGGGGFGSMFGLGDGFGDDLDCTVDGVDTACGSVAGLGSGQYVACPFNNCTEQNTSGQQVQFAAPLGGEAGYYALGQAGTGAQPATITMATSSAPQEQVTQCIGPEDDCVDTDTGSLDSYLPPSFYSANVTLGFFSQSISYVPSTNSMYYGFGGATGAGFSVTAGWAKDPNGFLKGASASGCFFAGVGGCAGGSLSGQGAVQLGFGEGDWAVTGGYNYDPVTGIMMRMAEGTPGDPQATRVGDIYMEDEVGIWDTTVQ